MANIGHLPSNGWTQWNLFPMYGPSNPPVNVSTFLSVYHVSTIHTCTLPRLDIVQVPASASVLGKRSRAADDSMLSDLPWLAEVHSKVWNREGLKPQLFREVKVTGGDYAALQECLKELHPDRDSRYYYGDNVDVKNAKLDFLQSLPLAAEDLSPQHPNDNDNRVDDDDDSEENDPVIKKLFPSILRFLDLSTLNLKERIPSHLPLPLLLRQEYNDISELIKEKPQSNRGSVIISGQPGTGGFLVFLSHRI